MQIEPTLPDPVNGLYSNYAMYSGFSIVGAGVTCGFANLVCGWVGSQ
jgi:F0F1-type ATP synthase membrane subunit c/vacuolar-type H+-ATPase subunit K